MCVPPSNYQNIEQRRKEKGEMHGYCQPNKSFVRLREPNAWESCFPWRAKRLPCNHRLESNKYHIIAASVNSLDLSHLLLMSTERKGKHTA